MGKHRQVGPRIRWCPGDATTPDGGGECPGGVVPAPVRGIGRTHRPIPPPGVHNGPVHITAQSAPAGRPGQADAGPSCW